MFKISNVIEFYYVLKSNTRALFDIRGPQTKYWDSILLVLIIMVFAFR